MKKLFLVFPLLFALGACERDGGAEDSQSSVSGVIPRFYGAALPDDSSPATRGVANALKVWSRPIAKEQLTVKFLNGTDRYREFVKEVVLDWERCADVKFRFVDDDQDALIRVGFDYVRGMQSSWALTGTDHAQKFAAQDEATVHFAQWRRASDAAKRSDVLRAFGQVLGLELEFRHPSFYPEWIVDADGNIDEETIRYYWENELAELIAWEELKKVVLEPLSNHAFLISKTESYDPRSVMWWPFYEMIANNIPVVEFDEDYRTELSEQDKAFIESLYGKPTGNVPPEEKIGSHLVSFDTSESSLRLSLTMSKNLAILEQRPEDEEPKEVVRVFIPEGATTPYTADLSLNFSSRGEFKVIIAELQKYGEQAPSESYALTGLDFQYGEGIENLNLQVDIPNKALTYLRMICDGCSQPRHFDFTGTKTLKELYLVHIGDSKVTLDSCPDLEVFATTKYLCMLDLEGSGLLPDDPLFVPSSVPGDGAIEGFVVREPYLAAPTGLPVDSFHRNELKLNFTDTLVPIIPPAPVYTTWPVSPEPIVSISEKEGSGLTISNCEQLKAISLENTQLKTFDFSALPHLEYIYLSSVPSFLVGGGTPLGTTFETTMRTLPYKRGTPGQIIVRGIGLKISQSMVMGFVYRPLTYDTSAIDQIVTRRNWIICWDPVITEK